ncbi:MAG: tRNA (adenosine(37)-N6)-threonylcarbamoyltransferase complex dimerization subunit type 1 TsaB [Dysgonamonadaceae bacterium]|nr:tRNA (adenosine(37)-N6)-threonylcarbamoyltransferase complex dimerization subunit type 1 TsaB [Dysgonamonadaceae bacterium]MDD4727261.1 tRNA (adenosine(37)-N6)-threonylcarbamoyltransferase complex dimerization subunit type 1 TsaB [Dysgonamonadaceae bacterium]
MINSPINILHIETATQVCSCALSSNNKIVFNKESFAAQSHSTLLGVFVEEAITFARKNKMKIHAISVSSGPGSYTGLRIGVSEAKGVAYGLGTKLIGLPTLKIMASMVKDKVDLSTLLCPMIDARRMEVYSSVFDSSLNIIEPTTARIIDSDSYMELLSEHKIAFFGDGSLKCKDIISHPNAIFLPEVHPLASGMINLSNDAFENAKFEDVAYFEPFYLKDFLATKPRNKMF